MTRGSAGRQVLLLVLCSVAACGTEPAQPAGGPPPEEEEKLDAAAGGGRGGATGSPDARPSTGGTGAVVPDAGSSGAGGMGGAGGGSAGGTGGSLSADAGRDTGGGSGAGGAAAPSFSFFVTSLAGMRKASGSENGFGGDLRFGEPTGLEGADKICRTLAEAAMPGAGARTWRAFLSVSKGGPDGGPIHAIDRVGEGPWYDRMGRLVAMDKAGLIAGPRPAGNAAVVADLPNENGVPNRMGTDNHDTLTGSNRMGRYVGTLQGTCNDWTSAVGADGRPQIGHSWPRSATSLTNGAQWIADHTAPGCAAGVNTSSQMGPSFGRTVGASGGYGGIYCFALR